MQQNPVKVNKFPYLVDKIAFHTRAAVRIGPGAAAVVAAVVVEAAKAGVRAMVTPLISIIFTKKTYVKQMHCHRHTDK